MVNTWNDQHSPRKTVKITSPRKLPLYTIDSDSEDDVGLNSPSASPSKPAGGRATSPTKYRNPQPSAGETRAARKDFDARKEALAESFLQQLDARITDNKIGALTASTGGVRIVWSNKLNSTAGRANWRREAVRPTPASKPPQPARPPQPQPQPTSAPQYRHVATIELATKVVTTPQRLHDALAHEFCHLANFMVSRELAHPHGASFQRWAAAATAAFGASHGVRVTTRHDYEIEHRYAWLCVGSGGGGCGMEYARHSRSIDPARHTCGRCRGRLQQTRPRPRGGGAQGRPRGEGAAAGGQSEYRSFVKRHFSCVRADLPPRSPMKDVMRELGARYRSSKADGGKTGARGEVEVVEVVDGDDDDDAGPDVVDAPVTTMGRAEEVGDLAGGMSVLTVED